MNILFLAPHPFYQERGTPIAIRLLLETVAEALPEVNIDLVTYHEGTSITAGNISIHRIPKLFFLSGIRAGISVKKLVCDFLLLLVVIKLLASKGLRHYKLVHAVEESVFIALALKLIFRIQYIYDMDSLLSLQTVEKWKKLKVFGRLLCAIENFAIRHSLLVLAVCQSIYNTAIKAGAKNIVLLRDIPPQELPFLSAAKAVENLRETCQIPEDHKIATYIGNLEVYQGIDLLIEGFCRACESTGNLLKFTLCIIGGPEDAANAYRIKAAAGPEAVTAKIKIIGARPLSDMKSYIEQSDVLISPRILGNNTPMKIYGFLASGKAVIATNIPSHTEILTGENSILIDANPESLEKAILQLAGNAKLAEEIGSRAKIESAQKYSLQSYQSTLVKAYREALSSIPK